jgi:hypothetical protein
MIDLFSLILPCSFASLAEIFFRKFETLVSCGNEWSNPQISQGNSQNFPSPIFTKPCPSIDTPLEFFVNGPSGRVTVEAIKVAAACFSLSLLLGSFTFFALGKLFYGTILFVS